MERDRDVNPSLELERLIGPKTAVPEMSALPPPLGATVSGLNLALIRLAHAAREPNVCAIHRGRCGAVRLTGCEARFQLVELNRAAHLSRSATRRFSPR